MRASFRKLQDLDDDSLWPGAVFRVRGEWPYEEVVDFMLFRNTVEANPFGLIVTSGFKAGSILVLLPGDCCAGEGGISRDWIVDNWSRWVYPQCDVADVYVADGYDACDVSGASA